MGIFNSIKKSRRVSSDIDEKIEYLNKELEKTGLREAMSTSNIYVGGQSVDNPIYTSFNNATFNGLSLGHSGADGVGSGGAYTGKMIPSEVGLTPGYHDSILNTPKAALSPPHPVSGKRRYASTRLGGMIGQQFFPTQPGVIQGNRTLPTGSVAWLWNPNENNSDGTTGNWYPLEFEPHNGLWGFWDTNFMGFAFLNLNLDQLEFTSGDNTGSTVVSLFSSIGISNKNNVGTEKTIVLQKNDLDDPGFLPINIDGLSSQGFNYLLDKATPVVKNYSDLKPFEQEILQRGLNFRSGDAWNRELERLKKMYPGFVPKASVPDNTLIATTDLSSAFPPSPSDKEPVDPPPETPDEPPTPPEPSTDSDEKADPAGLDARAIRLGYNDPYYPVNPTGHYTAMVTTAQDILSAEMDAEFYSAAARGESPNYNTTTINKAKEKLKQARADLDNWERWKKENNYIWKGSIDSSAEADRRQALLDKDKALDKEKKKLDKDTEKNEKEAEEAAAKLRALIAEIGLELAITLFGGKIATLTGKALGKIPAVAKFFKLSKAAQKAQIDDALKAAKKSSDSAADEILDALKDAIGGRTKLPTDAADEFMDFVNSDLMGRNITKAIKAGKKTISFPFKGKNVDINVNKLQQFRLKGTNYQQLYQSHKPDGKLLSEAAKLGHFEPEALTVDIEDLRKGIMPEFPKNPPPEMIDGYAANSRLAPKKIERDPFIKITKKDLAMNHKLKDSEIKDFMNQINAVNDFIKKHPEELIYAQARYPKSDPRLAQLNWEMDQKLNASKKFMDKHYPENQKLFTKIQKSIKKNIELTDPKSFKGVKIPKFKGVDLTDYKRRKALVSRHFKKAIRRNNKKT